MVLTIPTSRMIVEEIQEDMDDIHAKGRLADLEGLEEK